MKTLAATLAAAVFAVSGATAFANADDRTHNDVSVVSVNRAAGAVTVSNHGVLTTLDVDQMRGVYLPLNVSPGDTLRLTYEGGSLESVRPLG